MDRKTLKRLRNRVSASRCRVKKKLWIHDMEIQAERLAETNAILQHRIHLLEEAINQSRQMLAYHDSVGEILTDPIPQQNHLAQEKATAQ
jgi:cyclic AMP-dependent transcription factor ATF-2